MNETRNPQHDLMSVEIDKLAEAMCEAQGELTAYREGIGGHYKNKYATINSALDSIRAPLQKYGLSVYQPQESNCPTCKEDNRNYLITILMHKSGQWIRAKIPLVPDKPDVMGLKSYNTYMRRMCLESLLGISTTDEDDDGVAATFVGPTEIEILKFISPKSKSYWLNVYKIKDWKDLTIINYKELIIAYFNKYDDKIISSENQ